MTSALCHVMAVTTHALTIVWICEDVHDACTSIAYACIAVHASVLEQNIKH